MRDDNGAPAEARRFCGTVGSSARSTTNESLEAVLHRATVDDLRLLQQSLYPTLRAGAHPTESFETRGDSNNVALHWDQFDSCDVGQGTPQELALMGAVAVAIAWWTHRAKPAPEQRILQSMDVIVSGHAYLLAIPRYDACFCGSEAPFRTCHGRPPNAVPLTAPNDGCVSTVQPDCTRDRASFD